MLAVHLLGPPHVDRGDGRAYAFRSRKSWALLAYLLFAERPPTRSQLAALLYADADDPLRALRWNLTEIRRCLGEDGSVDGDPVTLRLSPGTTIDGLTVARGTWTDAVELPGIGAELLDGIALRGCPAFESWLLSQRRRIAAASEAILHEAALGWLSRGDPHKARAYAVRAAAMNPLDENHQALLIRLYRLAGDEAGANAQYAACVALLDSELGVPPGPAVEAALREPIPVADEVADPIAIEAIVEAGSAAVGAGAVQAGLQSVRTAIRLADRAGDERLRVAARLVLAETLIHSVGGFDEEGLATLHEADRIASSSEDAARIRAELGYVDYLRARYDRAQTWLHDALAQRRPSPSTVAKATTYLGMVESDRANYPQARTLLTEAVRLARANDEPRREAYALAGLGRISLLRGEHDLAVEQLGAAIAMAERHHWLSFLPWPQALLGEARLLSGDPPAAEAILRQAYARACQVGDPCWEGISARGLALHAAATGDPSRGFDLLAEARKRSTRHTDPYVWLSGYILDAQCALGLRLGHPSTAQWAGALVELSSRTGMRELLVRGLRHRAALGDEGDGTAATLIAAELDNPLLAT